MLLAGVLVLILAGCAAESGPRAAATSASAPGTATVAVHAYTPSGHLAVPVGDPVRGQCWTTSIAAPVPNAYRCFQGDKILDPCFAPPAPTSPVEVVCLATPWSDGVLLRVIGKLPDPAHAGAVTRPWAFQLDNRARCVASTGMVPQVAGQSLGYHCTDGGDAALRSDGVDTVTADYAAAGATTVHTMSVITIWRA